MPIVDVDAAQADFEGLIDRACSGEEIVISCGGKPVAKLVPIHQPKRQAGVLKGFTLPDEFFDPLPDDELDAWEQ
jgi:prevent-host-death family protein